MKIAPNHATYVEPRLPHYNFTRPQMLLTSAISFSALALPQIPRYPFHPGFVWCAAASGVVHLLLFFFFKKIFPLLPLTLTALSVWNFLLLGFVTHFSGGITSPFLFLFVAIPVSEAAYGIDYPISTVLSIGVFISLICFEFFGFLPTHPISSIQIFQSGYFTLFTTTVIGVFILFTGISIKQITRNLRNEIELENAKKQELTKQLMTLEAPSQIGLVVNKIVHDVRGPLGAIGGFIRLLKDDQGLDEESRIDCEVMLTELKRITGLVDCMINYTRPGESAKEFLSLRDVLRNILAVISFYPGANHIRFQERILTDNLLVYGNKAELQQVYFNLIKNAIEALAGREKMGEICVDIRQFEKFIQTTIEDNGPGMPADVCEAINKSTRFTRAASTKKEGAGLGLVIVKEIVDAYGGTVVVESQPAQWTRVVTRLPSAAFLNGLDDLKNPKSEASNATKDV